MRRLVVWFALCLACASSGGAQTRDSIITVTRDSTARTVWEYSTVTRIVVTVTAPPSCTVSVSTVGALLTALANAKPGDRILLAPGTYSLVAQLIIAKGGTAAAPVVIEGAGSSTTIIDVNQKYLYLDASYVHLRRLRLTNFPLAGLWLRGVTGVVLDSVEIDHTQHEAVAIKNGSHHNIITNSLFHDTGIGTAQYGEGIYIGGSGVDAAHPLDFGVTDNQILNNHFGPNVRADGVDVKEGADRTLIRGNFFDGSGAVWVQFKMAPLVAVLANSVTVDSNFFQYGRPQAVSFVKPVTRVMAGNLATRNTIDLRDQFQSQRGTQIPYGFQFQAGTTQPDGAVIKCDNVMVSGLLSNRPCTP